MVVMTIKVVTSNFLNNVKIYLNLLMPMPRTITAYDNTTSSPNYLRKS